MILLLEIFEMDSTRKLSFLVFLLCVLISLKKENADTKKRLPTVTWSSSDSASILAVPLSMSRPMFLSTKAKKPEEVVHPESLEYDFYRESCPQAEKIIRSRVHHLNKVQSDVAPALLLLVFHDYFVEGCDASVLLDATDGADSEKEPPPNEILKGFHLIDIIKSELEEACPGIVSCADILVLAARESVAMAGGPFYPLQTGRRDCTLSFSEASTYELPSPQDDLLDAHSIGRIHFKFFISRLYNFGGTDEPDPSMDIEFLDLLRSRCNNSHTSLTLSPSSFNGSPSDASPSSETWVRAYASDVPSSNLKVLTVPMGQVRISCSDFKGGLRKLCH